MSLIHTLEAGGPASLSAVEHAAAWLIGTLASGQTALHTLVADSPLVAQAIVAGEALASAHGVPIAAIVDVGGAVLAAAQAFVVNLTQTPQGHAAE